MAGLYFQPNVGASRWADTGAMIPNRGSTARLGSPTGAPYTPAAPAPSPIGAPAAGPGGGGGLKENWSLISLPKDPLGLDLNRGLQANLGADVVSGRNAIGAYGAEQNRQQPLNLGELTQEQHNLGYVQNGGLAGDLKNLLANYKTSATRRFDNNAANQEAQDKAMGTVGGYTYRGRAALASRNEAGALLGADLADRWMKNLTINQDALMRTYGLSNKLGQDYAGNLLAPTEAMTKFNSANIANLGGTLANTNSGTMFGANNGLPLNPWQPPGGFAGGWAGGGGSTVWGGSVPGGGYFNSPRPPNGNQPRQPWQPPSRLGAPSPTPVGAPTHDYWNDPRYDWGAGPDGMPAYTPTQNPYQGNPYWNDPNYALTGDNQWQPNAADSGYTSD